MKGRRRGDYLIPPRAAPLPPARRCQYPLWGFREAPTHKYCGAPAAPESSYRDEHHALCWRRHMRGEALA